MNATDHHAHRLPSTPDTRDTAQVTPQRPHTSFHTQVRDLFAFLATETGFTGPHTPTGLGPHAAEYRRHDLRITIVHHAGHEPEVATTVWNQTPCSHAEPHRQYADLCCLYVAGKCGPPQDVPGTAPNPKTVTKRLHQHAAALKRVLPLLDTDHLDELMRRCTGRGLPDDWRIQGRNASHRHPHGHLDTDY